VKSEPPLCSTAGTLVGWEGQPRGHVSCPCACSAHDGRFANFKAIKISYNWRLLCAMRMKRGQVGYHAAEMTQQGYHSSAWGYSFLQAASEPSARAHDGLVDEVEARTSTPNEIFPDCIVPALENATHRLQLCLKNAAKFNGIERTAEWRNLLVRETPQWQRFWCTQTQIQSRFLMPIVPKLIPINGPPDT
jgi:hypothetical protein